MLLGVPLLLLGLALVSLWGPSVKPPALVLFVLVRIEEIPVGFLVSKDAPCISLFISMRGTEARELVPLIDYFFSLSRCCVLRLDVAVCWGGVRSRILLKADAFLD